MSPGSEMPPGVASDPEGVSAVIFAVCMGKRRGCWCCCWKRAPRGRRQHLSDDVTRFVGVAGEGVLFVQGSPRRLKRLGQKAGRAALYLKLTVAVGSMAGIFDGLTRRSARPVPEHRLTWGPTGVAASRPRATVAQLAAVGPSRDLH
jgi:hypothetical protein